MVKGAWMTVKILLAQGVRLAKIARDLGIDPKTARRLARSDAEPKPARRRRRSMLDPYRDWLADKLALGVPAAEAHRQLRKLDCLAAYSTVRDLAAALRPAKAPLPEEVRFETPPGKQAQIDWSSCGKIDDAGCQRLLYLFTMILCYSRMAFGIFTTRMDELTLQRCHVAAFCYFGGVPHEGLYDNLKTVTIGRDAAGLPIWQSAFADFDGRYGFTPRCAQPYRAKTKGKIERSIGFVKSSFLPGRNLVDLADANVQLEAWLQDANGRVHRTHGQIVCERFIQEKPLLMPLRPAMANIDRVVTRVVSAEGWIAYEGNRYELPLGHRGKAVLVRDDGRCVRISDSGTILCEHPRLSGRGQIAARVPAPGRRRIVQPVPSELLVMRRPLSVYEEVAG